MLMAYELPITLIGGYLGCGKTTLVNSLLRHADGLKLAVLVNEFGEMPIDADLIEAQDDDLISIAGGCICCSYGDDMLEGIQRLRDLPAQPDHLLIEASGVAMPQAIAAAMRLVSGVSLHSIVVVADAETLHERSCERYMGDTVTRQLQCADLLILNRCDLATEEDKQLAYAVLTEHAADTTVVETDFANVPLSALLDRELRSVERYQTSSIEATHASFTSMFIPCSEPLDPQALGEQLLGKASGIVRVKGFVKDKVNGGIYLLQISGKRLRIIQADTIVPGIAAAQSGRENGTLMLGIVVIGVKPQFDEPVILQMVHPNRNVVAGS